MNQKDIPSINMDFDPLNETDSNIKEFRLPDNN